jgi:hypothetical protein
MTGHQSGLRIERTIEEQINNVKTKKPMKKIIFYFNCILMFALMFNVATAQTQQPTNQQPTTQRDPRIVTDQATSDRLLKDLNNRNAMTMNQPISWYDAGYGYYGTYMIDSTNYMTRYDRSGNFVETLEKKEWNSSVPSSVMSAFNSSPYKGQEVTSYYEVSEPARKGYYLELNDKGRTNRVWLDEQGKFSTQPPTIGTTKPINK